MRFIFFRKNELFNFPPVPIPRPTPSTSQLCIPKPDEQPPFSRPPTLNFHISATSPPPYHDKKKKTVTDLPFHIHPIPAPLGFPFPRIHPRQKRGNSITGTEILQSNQPPLFSLPIFIPPLVVLSFPLFFSTFAPSASVSHFVWKHPPRARPPPVFPFQK